MAASLSLTNSISFWKLNNEKHLFIIAFLFYCLNFVSQNKTKDSILLVLKGKMHDTTRCNLLNDLIELEENDSIWQIYSGLVIQIAEKNLPSNNLTPQERNNFSIHLAANLNSLGSYANQTGDIDGALVKFNKALKIYETHANKRGLASTYNNIGSAYHYQGDMNRAITYFTKSLKISEELGNKEGEAHSLHNIGVMYEGQGNLPKALEHFHKSYKIWEQTDKKTGLASDLNSIANVYLTQREYPKALSYFLKSLKLYTQKNNKNGMGTVLLNIGSVYKYKGKFANARYYYLKGLKIFEASNNTMGVGRAFNYIGATYKNKDELPISLQYYEKALKIFTDAGSKVGIATVRANIGKVNFEQKNYATARQYGIEAYRLDKEIGNLELLSQSSKLLYDVYKAENNMANALEMHEKYIFYRDSLLNMRDRNESIKAEYQFEYEKKITADSVKTVEEKKVIAAQFKQEKTQRYALYGGLTMIALFALFMVNRFRIIRNQKQLIELKEKETQKQKNLVEEKQKEILASIRYAKRIQESLLPSEKYIDRNFKELKK